MSDLLLGQLIQEHSELRVQLVAVVEAAFVEGAMRPQRHISKAHARASAYSEFALSRLPTRVTPLQRG